jgi:hypothetical protein
MSQWVDAPTKTFTAGAAIAQHLRVQLSSGVLQLATATVRGFGNAAAPAFASGDEIAVILDSKTGTTKMVAAGAVTSGAYVYAAAGGKVAATGYHLVGQALEAATADNDVIEVMPLSGAQPGEAAASVAAAGSAQGDAAALTGRVNTVSGADGTKGVILVDNGIGTSTTVYNPHASNGLKVYPPSGDDINDGTQDAAVTIEGKTVATFTNLDGTTWIATYTANS